MFIFFFFKQKRAYEMRISDGSSDVCSSDLGTLTPLPQAGNPRPRRFRLVEDRAVVNRMGFNNGGQAAAAGRIACLRRHGLPVPLGINIGANKDSADRIADYAKGAATMAPLADYLTVNISSHNTPGLRSEKRRVGKAWVRTGECRGAGDHYKKKK